MLELDSAGMPLEAAAPTVLAGTLTGLEEPGTETIGTGTGYVVIETSVEEAGQFVTVEAHEITVTSVV